MANNITVVLQGTWKVIVLFGTGSTVVIFLSLIIMTILKQVFGISTKKLVYDWLRIK